MGAFFAVSPQKTGLSAPIPHKPLRGLLRYFRFYPLRAPQIGIPADLGQWSLPAANSIYPPSADSRGNSAIHGAYGGRPSRRVSPFICAGPANIYLTFFQTPVMINSQRCVQRPFVF
jgi:hypothetical protein